MWRISKLKASKNFFQALGKKTESKPSSEMDRRFWTAFEAEFEVEFSSDSKRKNFSEIGLWEKLRSAYHLPVFLSRPSYPLAAILLLVVALGGYRYSQISTERLRNESLSASEVLLNQDLLEDFEMLSQSDDELLFASDEEWRDYIGPET